MTDLEKLIEAVESRNDARVGAMSRKVFDTPCQEVGLQVREYDCRYAYQGSLDAAKALHDALLPNWGLGVSKNVKNGYWYAWAHDEVTTHYGARGSCPARALLLATLKTYRSTQEASQ